MANRGHPVFLRPKLSLNESDAESVVIERSQPAQATQAMPNPDVLHERNMVIERKSWRCPLLHPLYLELMIWT